MRVGYCDQYIKWPACCVFARRYRIFVFYLQLDWYWWFKLIYITWYTRNFRLVYIRCFLKYNIAFFCINNLVWLKKSCFFCMRSINVQQAKLYLSRAALMLTSELKNSSMITLMFNCKFKLLSVYITSRPFSFIICSAKIIKEPLNWVEVSCLDFIKRNYVWHVTFSEYEKDLPKMVPGQFSLRYQSSATLKY